MCIVCFTVASVATVAASFVMTSCSKKEVKDLKTEIGSKLAERNLPMWVINPYDGLPQGSLAGVGISKKPGPNDQMRFLLAQAESQARAEIATTLQTEVNRLVRDAMQSASIEGIQAVESSFATVTEEVVKNVPVSGAVRDKIYEDKDGIFYVRMVINNSVIKNYLQARTEDYNRAMQNTALTRDQIQKTNQSLKALIDDLNFKTQNTQIQN